MAERELAVLLRDVDLGAWRPPRADPAPANEVDPTFHEFASDWYAYKELEVEPNTANHYRKDLTNHLLPSFKGHHLSQTTVAEVDRYRQSKVRGSRDHRGRGVGEADDGVLCRSALPAPRAPAVGAVDQHAHRPARADPRGGARPWHLESNPAVGKRRRAEGLEAAAGPPR